MRKTVSATDAVQAPVRVGQRPRRDHLPMAAIDHHQPPGIEPVGANAARAGADLGAALGGIDGIGDHQPRIVHHAIGIFERGAEWPLQRIADRMVRDIDRHRGRQIAVRGQPVVEQQAQPQQPWRALVGMRGDHEARSGAPDAARSAARCRARPSAARTRKKARRSSIGKIAMDQARRGRGCGGAEVALLEQDNPQAASRGVARNADAVQAAADDRKVVVRHPQSL